MQDMSDISGGASAPRDLSLAEMVETFDVTPRTVRYYEYMELIASRLDGRVRYYDARAQARFKLALRGRRFGMRLPGSRKGRSESARWYPTSRATPAAVGPRFRNG